MRITKPRVAALGVAAALMAATVPVFTPAQAASAGQCTVRASVNLSPGISAQPSKGTFSGRGRLACVGVLDNAPVAGIGSISFNGTYGRLLRGDTCEYGSGGGSLSASVPRVGGGSVSVSGRFTFVRAATDVTVVGRVSGDLAVANLQFIPALGQTCATRKVTRATVVGPAVIGGP